VATIQDLALLPSVQELLDQATTRVVRPPLFQYDERDDVRQDLTIHLLTALDEYKPALGDVPGFVYRILENAGTNLIRDRRRSRRRATVLSLDNLGEGADDAHPSEDLRRAVGEQLSEIELSELRQILAAELATLPDDLRELGIDRQTMTITEIAEKNSQPRTTVSDRFQRLSARLKDTQLRHYLDFVPSPNDPSV
jgi:RNA polymerase sigma factor (sigma-70 family)